MTSFRAKPCDWLHFKASSRDEEADWLVSSLIPGKYDWHSKVPLTSPLRNLAERERTGWGGVSVGWGLLCTFCDDCRRNNEIKRIYKYGRMVHSCETKGRSSHEEATNLRRAVFSKLFWVCLTC